MRGYGEIPESKVRELNGLVDEMVAAVEKLDSYLARRESIWVESMTSDHYMLGRADRRCHWSY